MDVTANNIANADTPGYRTERVQFSDWIDKQPASGAPPGGSSVTYTQDRATWREQQPGTLTHTANTFDLALTGAGYFTVSTKAGPRLTRGRPVWPDDRRHPGGQQRQCRAGHHRQADLLAAGDTQFTIASDGAIS